MVQRETKTAKREPPAEAESSPPQEKTAKATAKYSGLNIHQKMLKIADAAGFLQKTKAGFNYMYVPEELIQAKVTAGMQKYGVMLYHGIVPGSTVVTPYSYKKYDKKLKMEVTVSEIIVQADTYYDWVNVDNPNDKIHVDWVLLGQMEDVSQAFGGAETYCNRYFLMKTLQLATSEGDPDAYRSEQKKAAEYEEDKQKHEELKQAIQSIIKSGSTLIAAGANKSIVRETVAKFNSGDGNPSSIKSLEICAAVDKEFKKIMESLNKK